jgi:hypothetical protein
MLITGHFVVFVLAGLIAGLVLLASHYVFKAIDFHPHQLINYVYGSVVWMGCATIALFQSEGQDITTLALGLWVVLVLAGAFDFLAYALSRLGALNRAKSIKKEMKRVDEHSNIPV